MEHFRWWLQEEKRRSGHDTDDQTAQHKWTGEMLDNYAKADNSGNTSGRNEKAQEQDSTARTWSSVASDVSDSLQFFFPYAAHAAAYAFRGPLGLQAR